MHGREAPRNLAFEGGALTALEAAFGRYIAAGAIYMHEYRAESLRYWPVVEFKARHLSEFAEFFEERAAIIEHEGGFERDQAEQFAIVEVMQKFHSIYAAELEEIEATVRAVCYG